MTQAFNLSQFANNVNSSGVAQAAGGGTGTTTSTGSGSVVLGNNPTITNPILAGSTSGNITLAVPSVAGTNTATFPASTGTVMVSGNMPAFSAYQNNGGQSIASGTYTKIIIDTKEFDTASCFNTSTYRFTPLVAGYYQLNWYTDMGAYTSRYTAFLYKNGALYKSGTSNIGNGTNTTGTGGSSIVYANGSTDYFEMYVQGNNAATTGGNSSSTYFNGAMVRSA